MSCGRLLLPRRPPAALPALLLRPALRQQVIDILWMRILPIPFVQMRATTRIHFTSACPILNADIYGVHMYIAY